jgi:thioredoxin-related protein
MFKVFITCLTALWLVFLPASSAWAGIPAAYAPVVIEATGLPERHEFDLTAALQRARTEHKQLYVYLGATDCPFCRRYELFLARNAQALAPAFLAHFLVVDLRSNLRAPASQVFIRMRERSLAYFDFQLSIGDRRTRALVYPNVWLLDQRGLPLIQMPTGAGTFETVPEQLDVLRLEP